MCLSVTGSVTMCGFSLIILKGAAQCQPSVVTTAEKLRWGDTCSYRNLVRFTSVHPFMAKVANECICIESMPSTVSKCSLQ